MTVPAAQEDGAARRRLGAALRELLDIAVRADASEALFGEAADLVEALTRRLAAVDAVPEVPTELSAIRRDMSLVGGKAHPVGPQIEFAATDHGSVGTTTLGPVFEGGPGLVHGGVLALLLDHAMGHAAVTANYAAMTTELRLRFRKPTPLGATLRVAARLDRKTGRMLHLTGEISVDGATTVTAEGVFLTLTGANVASIWGTKGATPPGSAVTPAPGEGA